MLSGSFLLKHHACCQFLRPCWPGCSILKNRPRYATRFSRYALCTFKMQRESLGVHKTKRCNVLRSKLLTQAKEIPTVISVASHPIMEQHTRLLANKWEIVKMARQKEDSGFFRADENDLEAQQGRLEIQAESQKPIRRIGGRNARSDPHLSQQAVTVLLVSAKKAATICSMSLRTWWRKDAAGQVPAAVRIGGSSTKRWRLEELHRWSEAGCPSRDQWEQIKRALGNKE